METHAGRAVEFCIQMMNLVEAPQQGDRVIRAMPPVDKDIDENKVADEGQGSRLPRLATPTEGKGFGYERRIQHQQRRDDAVQAEQSQVARGALQQTLVTRSTHGQRMLAQQNRCKPPPDDPQLPS